MVRIFHLRFGKQVRVSLSAQLKNFHVRNENLYPFDALDFVLRIWSTSLFYLTAQLLSIEIRIAKPTIGAGKRVGNIIQVMNF